MFSYGSGLTTSMFLIECKQNYQMLQDNVSFYKRLSERIKISPQQYESDMIKREQMFFKHSYFPEVFIQILITQDSIQNLFEGTFYLTEVDKKWRRKYSLKEDNIQTSNSLNRLKIIKNGLVG